MTRGCVESMSSFKSGAFTGGSGEEGQNWRTRHWLCRERGGGSLQELACGWRGLRLGRLGLGVYNPLFAPTVLPFILPLFFFFYPRPSTFIFPT